MDTVEGVVAVTAAIKETDEEEDDEAVANADDDVEEGAPNKGEVPQGNEDDDEAEQEEEEDPEKPAGVVAEHAQEGWLNDTNSLAFTINGEATDGTATDTEACTCCKLSEATAIGTF